MNEQIEKRIAPIPTRYKGYHFRSRLEARYAVFFDALGLKWEYEAEGYDLGNTGWYLPDFWVPTMGWFIEIKGKEATKLECLKCEKLSELYDVFLFDGGLGDESDLYGYDSTPSATWYSKGKYKDNGVKFSKCPKCGSIDLTFDGWTHYSNKCECYDHDHRHKCGSFHPDIISALSKARSARFEHGESGAT